MGEAPPAPKRPGPLALLVLLQLLLPVLKATGVVPPSASWREATGLLCGAWLLLPVLWLLAMLLHQALRAPPLKP